MGYFRSLGVHTPAALPYLIAEGLLPKDPSRDLYKWETYADSDLEAGEDEIVATDSCVAWTRGGIVQKVYKFDVEKQKVIQALLTWFPADEPAQNALPKESESDAPKDPTVPETASTPKKPRKVSSAANTPSKRRHVSDDQAPAVSDSKGKLLSRALVVLLKHQAHVFFLAGSSHVINLPFEVERAFSAPRGLVLQRKIQPTENEPASPAMPRVPQNSFFSSQIGGSQGFSQSFNPQPQSSFPRQSFSSARGNRSRVTSGMSSFSLDDLVATSKKANNHSIPRLFSLMDPMSEVGLVVTETQEFGDPRIENIDKSEQVLYVSPRDELHDESSPKEAPLIIVVTINYETRMYSVWHAHYLDTKAASSATRRRSSMGIKKRRSSYGATTGATTPALRPREGARESLNIAKRGKTGPGSFHNSGIHSRDPTATTSQTAEEDLASQLDPDFAISRQPKESRRVSSLLARTELSSHHDRSAFQDLASTHDSQGTQGRRGASFGGPDRTSFGVGYAKHRMSSQNFQSRLSLDVASVDTSVADLTIDGDTPTSEAFDAMDLDPGAGLSSQDALDGLKKEFVLTRFSQISMDDPGQAPIFKSFASENEDSGDLKIFTIKKPQLTAHGSHGSRCYVFLSDHARNHVLGLGFDLKRERALPRTSNMSKQLFGNFKYTWTPNRPKWTRNKDYIDVIKIEDHGISRLVGLQPDKKSLTGAHHFRIFAPWCDQFEVIYGHPRFKLNNALEVPNGLADPKDKDAGRRRTLDTPQVLRALSLPGVDGRFDLIDGDNRYHRFQISLAPSNDTVRKALEVCQLLLPELHAEFLMVAWWKMTIQLKVQKTGTVDEWQAFVSALLCLIVPFLDGFRPNEGAGILRPLKQDEKTMRNQNPLASLGKAPSRFNESSAWNKMWQIEAARAGPKFWNNPAWNWTTSINPGLECKESQHGFIPKCIANAQRLFETSKPYRDFIKSSPLYKNELDPDANDVLPRLLVGLHLVYEEQKLNDFKNDRSTSLTGNLGPVLVQLGHWLQFEMWGRLSPVYLSDKVAQNHYDFEDSTLKPRCISQPMMEFPPSVIDWIEESLKVGGTVPMITLAELCDLANQPGHAWSPQNLEAVAKMANIVERFTPRTLALIVYFGRLEATDGSEAAKVETMFSSGITSQILETFPDAIAATLREAMVACEASPPTTWSNDLLKFVGREDLEVPFQQLNSRTDGHLQTARTSTHATNNLHSICQSAEEPEPVRASPEADRFSITRLLFSEDQRFIEAARLLEPLKAPVAECIPDPSWTEAEYLEAQKGVMQWVMVRTFALPPGQGMLLYDSKKPLITEKFPLHGFTTVCIMKPMGNHVSADRSNYSEEKDSWAFFHAGVSAGLTISREAEGIDTSWIMFNKPAELHNRHAGLLLALGLNGHLKNIAKWLSFKYLTPKHTMTSIGLLLGLSASYLGTMDPLVTRLLSVHVTRMLPVGAAELNLSPLTQTTGLMGIGLLYCNTQHRRMSEVMLSEIEHAEVDDPAVAVPQTDNLRDEGYRLAAGFALGYINLGKGSDLKGLHDMRLLERLLSMAVGPRPIDMVHFLDRATAGAVVAIALIFMKTENRSVANKIDIPDTIPQFDYVRPDIFLLRTLAKHLILWNDIEPKKPWMLRNLPAEYSDLHNMKNIRSLRSDHMPFYNITAGLLFSIALKYAGSGHSGVRDFLIRYLDQFIRIAHLPALRYDARLVRNTVRNCQDLIALSAATVMAGMGDLDVFRRLRLLHGRIGPEIPYGSHLAAHMALGVLFLGGGSYTFGTSNLAIASLICAFYPLYPSSVLDNKAHLQAFRHFWVLAASPRCLVIRDVYTRRAINLPVVLTLKDSSTTEIMAPSLLPALDTVATIQTNSPEYWQVTLDFVRNPAHLAAFSKRQTLWVRRRSPSDAHSSVFSAALSALNSSQQPAAIFGPTAVAPGFQSFAEGRWEWLFELPTFRRLFHREDWGAALPGDPGSSLALSSDTTAVDARLGLHAAVRRGVESIFLADMNELRMLFLWLEWAEDRLNRGQRLRWISKEAIVQIRMDIEDALIARDEQAVID